MFKDECDVIHSVRYCRVGGINCFDFEGVAGQWVEGVLNQIAKENIYI